MDQVQNQGTIQGAQRRPATAPSTAPLPGDLTVSPEQQAERYAATFEARDDTDYEWVHELALKKLEEVAKAAEYLDTKAEKLVVFTAAAASLLTAALSAALARGVWPVAVFALPSLVLGLTAVTLGLRVQRPTTQSGLPEIKDTLEYAEMTGVKEKSLPAFDAKLHWTAVRQARVSEEKAETLKKAHEALLYALWLLLLPVLAGLTYTFWPR